MKLFQIFLLFFPFSCFSQQIITGTIKSSSGELLIGASAMIVGSYDGSITDSTGTFSFNTTQTGTQTIIFKFIGHEPATISLEINGPSIVVNAVLKEKLNELNSVVINAGSFEAGDKRKAVALSSIDMITVPGAQGNIVGALQYLPGTSNNAESGKLFVRGGESSESQVYIDGTIVPVPFNPSAPNTAVRSRFNPFLFDGTVFSTGGFSAEYGQAMSAVLLLDTKGIQEQDQLDISILSVGLGLAGTKKWDKGAITLSAEHTNLRPYMTLVPQQIDWVKMPASTDIGLNFRQKTKKGLFKFYSTYTNANFQLNRADISNDLKINSFNLNNSNYYNNASWKGQLGKSWIAKVSGGFTFNEDLVYIEKDKFKKDLKGGHLKIVLNKQISNKIKLITGTEAIGKDYAETYTSSTLTNYAQFTNINYGTFVEANIYLTKKFVLRLGGRAEYSTHLERTNLSPRASLAMKTGEKSQVSGAYGMFSQNPSETYLIYTNRVDFEQADQYMLNYQWSKNKRTLRAEVYYKNYKSLIKFTDHPFYEEAHYTNSGKGYAAGFDLFFRDKKTIKNGDYWISYSFLDTKREYLNFPEKSAPSFASKHNFAFVYKHWVRKWRSLIGASFNYSSPRNFDNPNTVAFNAEKMKAFQSLNLNYTFLYRENIIIYASASNVLGYKQEFGYEYASTPNAEGVYAQRLIEPPAPRFFIIGCFITLSKTGDQNQLDKIQ